MKKDKNIYLLPNIKMTKNTREHLLEHGNEHEKHGNEQEKTASVIWRSPEDILAEVNIIPKADTNSILSFDTDTAANFTEEELALKDKIKWEIDLNDLKSFEKFWEDIWTEIKDFSNQIIAENKKVAPKFKEIWNNSEKIRKKIEKNINIDSDDVKWLLDSSTSLCDEIMPILDNFLIQNKAKINKLRLYIMALIEIKNELTESKNEDLKKVIDKKHSEFMRLMLVLALNDGKINLSKKQIIAMKGDNETAKIVFWIK